MALDLVCALSTEEVKFLRYVLLFTYGPLSVESQASTLVKQVVFDWRNNSQVEQPLHFLVKLS